MLLWKLFTLSKRYHSLFLNSALSLILSSIRLMYFVSALTNQSLLHDKYLNFIVSVLIYYFVDWCFYLLCLPITPGLMPISYLVCPLILFLPFSRGSLNTSSLFFCSLRPFSSVVESISLSFSMLLFF